MILDATEKSLARFVDTAWMTSRNAFGEFGEDFIENELATDFPKPKLCDVCVNVSLYLCSGPGVRICCWSQIEYLDKRRRSTTSFTVVWCEVLHVQLPLRSLHTTRAHGRRPCGSRLVRLTGRKIQQLVPFCGISDFLHLIFLVL